MELLTYYKELNVADRERFAARAKTTDNYLKNHIMKNPPLKGATLKFMERLALATEGTVTLESVIEHFRQKTKEALQ